MLTVLLSRTGLTCFYAALGTDTCTLNFGSRL